MNPIWLGYIIIDIIAFTMMILIVPVALDAYLDPRYYDEHEMAGKYPKRYLQNRMLSFIICLLIMGISSLLHLMTLVERL
jgi:hypothetical protein